MKKAKFKKLSLLSFKRQSFLLAVFFNVVMMAIYLLGNPRSGGFYWHFVPELCAIYLTGIWIAEINLLKFREIIGFYFLVVVSIVLATAQGYFLIVLPLGFLLGFPLLIGYLMEKRFSDKKQCTEC